MQLIINTYVSLMYELKRKIGKVLTSKSVGDRPSSYEKRIYRAAVSKVEKHWFCGRRRRREVRGFVALCSGLDISVQQAGE